MDKIICFFLKHKDGKKVLSYIDEDGKHYKSTCLRCGADIFYPTESEEFVAEMKRKASEMVDEAMNSIK